MRFPVSVRALAAAATPVVTAVAVVAVVAPARAEVLQPAIPLTSYANPALEHDLLERIDANPEWRALLDDEKLGVCVADLGDGKRQPRFAQANGGHMMYAASLPKIAVLLGAYVSFEDGSLPETPLAHETLREMIRVSSNAAATRMIQAVGLRKLEQIVQDPRYRFYDRANGGGLWIGKAYGGDGTRHGDPLFNISHGATATQVCRFYYQLAQERLVSRERSDQMLEDLSDSALGHKFMAYLNQAAPDAEVYRKSGTWRNWHADSALVRDQGWRNYVLVGLVESPDGEAVLRELIAVVDDLLEPRPAIAGR